jgi:hyaluronoglucosaminidase
VNISLPVPLGIVEGFFGPVWSWQERASLISTLSAAGYDRYIYAPKGDAALRRNWETQYSQAWLDALQRFSQHCQTLGVEFGVGISPYGLQNNLTTARLARLRSQIETLSGIGVRRIAILFDDMDINSDNLATTQLKIVETIVSAAPSLKFVVCPSYYSDDIVLDRVFGERPQGYLEALGRSLDSAIEVFWTGAEVCARQFGRKHLQQVGELFQRLPTLWDNYPVNDGPRMSNHLHIRAFTGRSANDAPYISAHMINPALQSTLSAIPALTLADVYSNGADYQYEQSFVDALNRVVGPSLAACLREDLIALQDTGLDRLATKREFLAAKYAQFDHPAAHEVRAWIAGEYSVSAEQVQTQ